MKWFAVYTKPRCEESVAFRLRDAGLNAISPRVKSRRFRGSRLVEDVEPLYPCYMFAEFEIEKYWHMITYTRGVRYIVGKENPIAVHEGIINAIVENTVEGVVVPLPPDLSPGDRVRIKDGFLKNFYGMFKKELNGSQRVNILLEALGCKVEVDKCRVEKFSK